MYRADLLDEAIRELHRMQVLRMREERRHAADAAAAAGGAAAGPAAAAHALAQTEAAAAAPSTPSLQPDTEPDAPASPLEAIFEHLAHMALETASAFRKASTGQAAAAHEQHSAAQLAQEVSGRMAAARAALQAVMYLRCSCMEGGTRDPSKVLLQQEEAASLRTAIAEEQQALQAALGGGPGAAIRGWLESLLQVRCERRRGGEGKPAFYVPVHVGVRPGW